MNACFDPARGNTATKLLLANLNSAAVCAQTNIRAAFADGGARTGVLALVIDADAEIIHVNGAVLAFCVEPEAGNSRQVQFNSAAYVVDIDISERSFGPN